MHKKIKDCLQALHGLLLILFWILARGFLVFLTPLKKDFIHIIPADKMELIGSKGDEAMLLACVEQIKSSYPEKEISITCINEECTKNAKKIGLNIKKAWKKPWMPFLLLLEMYKNCPEKVYLMGADIMDGHYSIVGSLKMFIAADLLARIGSNVHFLGFSFNNTSSVLLKFVLKHLSNSIVVNVRDSISLKRFKLFGERNAELVSDTAFLLKEKAFGVTYEEVKTWALEQRTLHKKIIVINYHPLLFEVAGCLNELEDSVLMAVKELSKKHEVSWLILPHDDRDYVGDLVVMESLSKRLNLTGQDVLWVQTPPSASEIKGLLKFVDGVITGRMHLSIAALGIGKPVLLFSYQGKFSGLIKHFNLPEWLEINPNKALNQKYLQKTFECFFNDLESLTELVESKLPVVKSLALNTFKK